MKRISALIIFNLMIVLLCGCNETEMTFAESATEIARSGEITQTIVENFDKDYYNIDELRSDFDKAISEYNNSDSDSVSLIDLHEEDGKVFASLSYSSYNVASKFLGNEYFYGTVNEAYDSGYLLDVNLKSVSDGSVIGTSELMKLSKNHIFIFPETGLVYTGYKILYVSPNVEILEDKKVRVSSDGDGFAYIVMK